MVSGLALFVDILDIQLQVLAWGLLAGAAWVLLRFGMPRGETEKLDKGFGYAFFTIGLYAFITGLWATFACGRCPAATIWCSPTPTRSSA